jgi:(E)-4-hydroxy-3-methylbut-2-enyl-diphosphate synthase
VLDPYRPRRRRTREVRIGTVTIGGRHRVAVQSMTTPDPSDIEGNVEQALRLVDAGCELVRVTTPTAKDAEDLGRIRDALRARNCEVPLVADIHFNPDAALRAADFAEKVRVNPGNYADSKRFAVREYDDGAYAAELRRIEERFSPLVEKCASLGRAIRIGTNHGSLSDRILNRFGDNPEGMVESALEFVRVAVKRGFHDLVLSMKASNVRVMVAAYRLLAARMRAESMDYPFHLGVTEAGGGRDGRVKSAIGIGTLLADGIGDTIRVSLTEDPVNEIPVARALADRYRDLFAGTVEGDEAAEPMDRGRDPVDPRRRVTRSVSMRDLALGGEQPVRVGVEGPAPEVLHVDAPVEFSSVEGADVVEVMADVSGGRRIADELAEKGDDRPVVLRCDAGTDPLELAVDLGSLLVDGIGDAVLASPGPDGADAAADLVYSILQASRVRMTRTDYIACPGCGRTLFDLEETTDRIRSRTGHLKDLKIAVMGCIVNGPGEMADADFGYVGAAPGMVSLYVGRECVERGIPTERADDRLVDLIREHGRWVEPAETP